MLRMMDRCSRLPQGACPSVRTHRLNEFGLEQIRTKSIG
jgi:hypothetical protein